MSRITAPARIAARGIDSEPFSHNADIVDAQLLKAAGIDFVLAYLGAISSQGIDNILSAGLAFMPVTYADNFDASLTIDCLQECGIPVGTTVWLDVESVKSDPTAAINTWAYALRNAGYDPGLYVGTGIGLSADELGKLDVDRYWRSCSYVPEPTLRGSPIGFCMTQLFPPNQTEQGVLVDYDFIGRDYHGRGPQWIVQE